MGTPAWQYREHEQQTLLEDFKREIIGLEAEHGEEFLPRLLYLLAEVFRYERHRGSRLPEAEFFDRCYRRIQEFSRGEEEENLLTGRLLCMVTDMIQLKSSAKYQRAVMMSTRQFLGVERSTDEID